MEVFVMYERYEELCKEKGVSNYRISKATGIPQATLSDWKNGKSTPKSDKLQIIADYFGVSVDYLIGKTDFITYSSAVKTWENFDKKYPNMTESNEIETIAAHHDEDNWTAEELEEIERFKEFVKMKRREREK
jgi:transcriptional regulator with XRE-family HTH domain